MKKIFILMLGVLLATFTGCKKESEEIIEVYVTPIWKGAFETAPANPEKGWAYYNTTDNKSYVYNGSSWDLISDKDVALGDFVFLNETKETIKGAEYTVKFNAGLLGFSNTENPSVEYTVKSYASVHRDSSYCYYKYYYSDGILCRKKTFSLYFDYFDKPDNKPYYEFSESDYEYDYTEVVFYPSGVIHFQNYFVGHTLSASYEYSENGNEKSSCWLRNGIIYHGTNNYEDGSYSSISYSEKGVIESENCYYPSGKDSYTSFMTVYYNDGTIYFFEYQDPKNNFATLYRWSDGKLSTYKDGEVIKEDYTKEQVLELIATLRPKE